MREKYESLSVAVLKDLAKSRGIKNLSGMKKQDLVEAMLAEDEREKQEKQEAAKKVEVAEPQAKAAPHRRMKREDAKNAEAAEEAKESVKEESTASATAATTNQADDSMKNLDSGITANVILEVMPDGYGFIRCENYMPGENDVYVSPSQIRRFNLKTGDIIRGPKRPKTQSEKFSAISFLETVNGTYEGIGCMISMDNDNNIVVISVFDDGPAKKAGLQEKDIITQVDGKDYSNKTSNDLSEYVKNRKKNTVELTIKRGNDLKKITIKRNRVEVPSVTSKVIEQETKKIGYIDISVFSSVTYEQFKKFRKKRDSSFNY